MKNNQFKIPENAQVHENFRTWKSGKKWLYASSILALLVSGGAIASSSQSVFADQVLSPSTGKTTGAENTATGRLESNATAEANNATVTSSANDTKSAAQSAATVASSASDTKSAAQSAATAASSASDTKSAGSSAATVASSSSATKADSTSANNISAVKTETTSASSSSATQADSANATSTNEYSASASNLSKTGAASTSNSTAVKTNAKYANSMETVDNNKRGNRENTHPINQRPTVKRSPIVTTEFAQNYGRKVLAGSVSDPDYPSGMWIDPDKSHYSYEWLQAKINGKNDGNQIVLSTNRTGDGIVYVTELSPSNEVLKQYTLNQNTEVSSDKFDSTTYYNGTYYAIVKSLRDPLAVKYFVGEYDTAYHQGQSYMVPKLITQTTYYVDKDGKQITDSNGNPVVPYTQKGLVGQKYTTSPILINGYYAIAPANSNGVMSPYGEIGASYVKDFHNGIVVTYTQTGSDGTMSASIAQNGKVLNTWTNIKPSVPVIKYKVGDATVGIKNPYIPQTSDVKYVYNKLGNWIVSNPDGSTKSIIYPNDPSDPTKIADSSVPGYPVIDFLPGYTPKDHMGTPLVPVDPDDHTKGYIPPTPSDIGKDTTITYTADKQTGSVSYVDDTTGTTLKTDSISGTTGSKSSYSTSGSIADYKKHGYELVTDGYPADLTFDNNDTTDQNFTVHLKHQLTPVNPTDPQTPGAPINPDEPDGPKWPTRTNYDKTVHETVSYVDQSGHVVAKPHTDSVNFTRTVVVDNVTGEVIISGAGTTAWTATNGDTTFDAVVSPVVTGSVANKAQTAAVTDLNADSADVNATVTYTKVGSLVPSSNDGNFPGAPKVVYPNDPKDATKVTPAGVPTVPGYTAHDPKGNVLTPGSRYQPSDPTKDTTITYTADQQTGSVSYVDDTTGKTLKTDSISGTTGSKSSYSTSGNIADYKKHGYELVTDGYPADLTFDNNDTTDQNFTVHLKHQLTPVNPTDPQTPGAPINPDEPDGPKWPARTNYDKTVNETVSYVDQTGHVVAKPHTDSVNFTRTVVVDNVTGEVITSGAGTKAWTATNGDTTFDAVVSPVVSGSVANKAQIAAVTDLNADSGNVTETVTYTKVGSLVPSSSDGNFPRVPTVVYPNDPSDATKVTQAGVPTVPGYTAHDPEGHVLTPGSSYQPSDPTKDTTITYTADTQKGSVSYVDDTTGKTLKTDSISGTTGSKSSYSTSGNIADYKKHGYELVTDGYPADLTFDNNDTTDQNFTVHLKHQLTPVNPTDPQTPGAPINPDEPDGPKWPEGTDKSSVTQTVIRTVNYLDKQTGKVVAKQVTEQVTYNRTAIVDKVTGQIIGYSTTGGDTVDQTDGDKAWTAVDNKSDWDSVTSPDLSSKGYLAPDLAKVAQQTVTPGDKDVTVNVYYDHAVVPVNPTNPQTPGTPINPDNPDGPKWPEGTDKNSLTTDVHQTIHYQYGDGSQAAPDKTDSTTFDHQVEIDKVTGEIVKDDGWTAKNGKTSFDSKNSPVIPGYTASKPASDPVDGLTQDSKDNVQTIVYAKTPVAGGNVTAKYVDENGNPIADDVIASGNVGDPYSTTQKDVPGYTFKEVQGNPTGSFTDQDQTVTYVYTKNPSTDNNGGTGPNQPEKPDNGTDTGNPSSNQPGNPSQPSNATNNGVINTLTNTGSKVNNGAVNSPELPQTGENNRQSQTMSFIGVSLAMFGSLLGFLGIKKRRND